MTLYCTKGHDNPPESRFCHQCGEKLPEEIAKGITAGMILGDRYEIIRELGHGGFGRTYLSKDINRFQELCVMKEFAPQVQGTSSLQKAEELFNREAGILYKLKHPQIPTFRELCRCKINNTTHLFLVQDYIEGKTYRALLDDRLNQGLGLTEAECTSLLFQILPVIEYIHSQGVIHRDISPDNLILRSKDGLPVLIDFGGVKQLAISAGSPISKNIPATRLGKIGYAPDEQMQLGIAYPDSDLYALAVTILVLLTGKDPQTLRDAYNATWIWQKEIKISQKLELVLNKMLAQNRDDRYQSARQVLQAIQGNPLTNNNTNPTQSPQNENITTPTIAIPTIAVAPGNNYNNYNNNNYYNQQKSLPSTQPNTQKSWGCGKFLLFLLVIVMAAGWGSWWLTNQLLRFRPFGKGTPSVITNNSGNIPGQPSYKISSEEIKRLDNLKKRSQELEINFGFLSSLTDKEFYTKNPNLQGRRLENNAADEKLRSQWDKIASDRLDQLTFLSPKSRNKLGSYTDDDMAKRKKAVNKKNLSHKALNDMTDAKFFQLFPEQKEQDFINQPIGQIWQAIASDIVEDIKNETALQTLQIESKQPITINHTLTPGGSKAYIARLEKNQNLEFNLQASPSSKILVSIYPPRSYNSPLLEDSQTLNWSGTLSDSGYYEFIIVSNSSQEVSYQLNLTVNNITPSKKP